MRKLGILMFILASSVMVAKAQDVVGDWQGMLHAGAAELPLFCTLPRGTAVH
ncbi:MAG: hypothetical protein ABSF71_28960 [Terriglobia bacterium]